MSLFTNFHPLFILIWHKLFRLGLTGFSDILCSVWNNFILVFSVIVVAINGAAWRKGLNGTFSTLWPCGRLGENFRNLEGRGYIYVAVFHIDSFAEPGEIESGECRRTVCWSGLFETQTCTCKAMTLRRYDKARIKTRRSSSSVLSRMKEICARLESNHKGQLDREGKCSEIK